MKKVFKYAVFSLGLVAASQGAVAAGDAAAGEAKTAVCAACHGVDGNSLVANFPKLAGLGEKYIVKQLKDIRTGRANGGRDVVEMTGMLNGMSDQDLADIAAYFSSKPMQLSGAKEIEVQASSGIKVDGLALGERVYRGGNTKTAVPACTGCHSPTGQGNSPAGYPRIGGQHAAYIEKQLRDFRSGTRWNDGDQKIMRQVAENMTDAEIIAVSNFIAGLN
ncbi:c-type cytochrome [Maricurvus nonylphenolicus]|uniref:c-type cytochrome n=1 Tax=Maricurvus nonylphenolicus TaxID=1008307 RepID=UPI0036F35B20